MEDTKPSHEEDGIDKAHQLVLLLLLSLLELATCLLLPLFLLCFVWKVGASS